MRRVHTIRCLALGIGTLLLLGCSDQEPDVLALSSQDTNPADRQEQGNPGNETHSGRQGPGPTNRLGRETSPYLLMHAHNPVDWYPWGPEAFERAKREDKPIFLSIGYSSCHWCHVMEREVFSREEIAKTMNKHFVCIKVDREERPDVDDIYMTALQVYFQASGSSQGTGWPLSIFLTPTGMPIAGGTYLPPEDEQGRIGFPTFLLRIHDIWTNRREVVERNADILTREIRRIMRPQLVLNPVSIERPLVATVVEALKDTYDPIHGGVGFDSRHPDRAKFPAPGKLTLLQYEMQHSENPEVAKIVSHTLEAIAAGGIHDHLGGGFHRYSTDREWHVPHFEKMLYDNAQLADVYVEAYRQTGQPQYRELAIDIFEFVLRRMTAPSGGFYSALDADTEGIEGQYYTWQPEEIVDILGPQDGRLFQRVYGMDRPAKFEHGYVLHLPQPLEEVAADLRMPAGDLEQKLERLRWKLLQERQQRPSPLLDDKILTSWNGLMIRALANGGRILQRPDYIRAAEKAALFLVANLRDERGRLLRTYRDRQARLNAYLDDYAFLVEGMLALHRATGDSKWLNAARRLTDQQIELFWDERGKGFFFTSHHHEELLARTKNAYDSVLPSGNSVSVRNLVRLASLSGQKEYRTYARETLELFAHNVKETPQGTTNMALAMAELLDDPDFKADARQQPAPDTISHNRSRGTGRGRSDPERAIVLTGEETPANDSAPSKSASDPSGDEPARAGNTVAPGLTHDSQTKPRKKDEWIQARAFLSVDRLPAGSQCQVILLLEIREGWHINTNPARPENLIPTKVSLVSRHGAKLTKLQYPTGHQIEIAGLDEPVHVYENRVAIRGVIEIPDSAAGKTEELELEIQYQACNDQRCLPLKRTKLRGSIAVAPPGETVKLINQKLFPTPKSQE